MKVIDMVRDNKIVTFQFYRDQELWYKTECGFEFPVPISDVGKGCFLNQDKAIFFLRWIQPQIKAVEAGRKECQVN